MISYDNFAFDITHRSKTSHARLGSLKTPHGTIATPNYIFCGTKAAIKALSPRQMREAQTDIILSNTYHLMIQPGADLIEKMGGLHKFMQWDGPMLTDSGGFQIFSMGHGAVANEVKGVKNNHQSSLLVISENGAVFRNYQDGSKILLTPERSMRIQRQLGADLLMQFDELPAYHSGRDYTAESMRVSMRWGDRCLYEFNRTHDGKQALYGIVQGGVYEDLRLESAEYTKDRPFFGTAIGGCLGGGEEEMRAIVAWCQPVIHPDRPVHFLGIGRIRDVFEFVRLGIDTFDCVIPTRLARHGMALVRGHPEERINLKNARYRDDPEPLDSDSDLPLSRDFSKAYIHHLIRAEELLSHQILSQHNVSVMNRLMREIRLAIAEDTLDQLQKEWLGG